MIIEEGRIPLLREAGVDATYRKLRSILVKGADGVVVSSYRLIGPNGFDNRWLETTTPPAPLRNGTIFFMAQPPLLRKEGITSLTQRFRNISMRYSKNSAGWSEREYY